MENLNQEILKTLKKAKVALGKSSRYHDGCDYENRLMQELEVVIPEAEKSFKE